MATERHDEDSSSRNDSLVLRITEGGAAGEIVQIDLSDGSSFFIPVTMVPATLPAVGEGFFKGAYEDLLSASESYAAQRKALDLLASREQSRARLIMKLEKRGFSALSISHALENLEAAGKLDDRRFAEVWITGRLRRNPEGRAKLFSGLLSQGVSREVANEALSALDSDDEDAALRHAAEKLQARGRTSPKKMMRALRAKGFPYRASLKEVFRRFSLSDENDLRELFDDSPPAD